LTNTLLFGIAYPSNF